MHRLRGYNAASPMYPSSRNPNRPRLKTWGSNKSVRLRGFDYAEHVPYHVVIRVRRNAHPFSEPAIARMVCTVLVDVFRATDAYLASFCVMPDHAHILCSPDQSGLTVGKIIGRFKSLSTRRSWALGWSGKLWQIRFYDHILRRGEDVPTVARYIFENPDRRGLASDYPYRWISPEST